MRMRVMKLLDRLVLAVTMPRLPKNVEIRQRKVVKDIVGAHSHGNIRLQNKQYFTKREINERYNQVAGVRFSG